MNNTLAPKLSPWLFAALLLTQAQGCARSESLPEETKPAPSVGQNAAPVKPALGADDTAEAAVRVPVDGLPSFGDAHAPVTVVAFTDYECPYCAKADLNIDTLREEYGDKLRVVVAMQPLPFHEHAVPAAKAFLAAVQQGKGELMHKKLFALSRAKTTLTDEAMRTAANELGLDLAAFDAARSSSAVADQLTKSQALATKLDVRGTPTFFTNGRRLVGARPIESFRLLFDSEVLKGSSFGSDPYASMMRLVPEYVSKPEVAEPLEHFDLDLAKSPLRGEKNGAVTVAIFSDYECPYCVKAERTIRDLELQKPGQIKVVYKFRPLPMHPHARDAAKASIAAEKQGKFWPYHDVLLQHREALEHADLVNYAGEVGLDIRRFERDMEDPSTEDRIKADEKEADAVGAKGTPTSFINGYKLTGAQPLAKWSEVVDHALKPR